MQLQSAMIFIDGTNLFYRLQAAQLVVPQFSGLFNTFSFVTGGRNLKRIYLYSTQPHVDAAKLRHGEKFLEGIRLVLGDSVPTSGPTPKEKGVDALLVADLVYHAASRNCDYAVLVSADTDFAHAVKRVEDFGCRTAVVGVCCEVPDRLKQSTDQTFLITADNIRTTGIGRDA